MIAGFSFKGKRNVFIYGCCLPHEDCKVHRRSATGRRSVPELTCPNSLYRPSSSFGCFKLPSPQPVSEKTFQRERGQRCGCSHKSDSEKRNQFMPYYGIISIFEQALSTFRTTVRRECKSDQRLRRSQNVHPALVANCRKRSQL